MKIVKDYLSHKASKRQGKIEISELKEMAKNMFGDFVKAVVDVEKEIMAVDAEFHSDLMQFLIEKENSEPKNLWGINFYPEMKNDNFIEFDSMINLKPGLGNRTRGVENSETREKIIKIVKNLFLSSQELKNKWQ